MNVKWLFKKCRRFEEDISLLAAGALAEDERAGVEMHLAECSACQARFAELKAVTGRGGQLRSALPQVEPSVALRRRWMTAVHELARPREEFPTAPLAAWLSGRRLAWGSLAAMWALIVFFQFSAPDVRRPAAVATASPSLREVLLALKVEWRGSPFRADAGNPARKKASRPDVLPPRSQRPGEAIATKTEAV